MSGICLVLTGDFMITYRGKGHIPKKISDKTTILVKSTAINVYIIIIDDEKKLLKTPVL